MDSTPAAVRSTAAAATSAADAVGLATAPPCAVGGRASSTCTAAMVITACSGRWWGATARRRCAQAGARNRAVTGATALAAHWRPAPRSFRGLNPFCTISCAQYLCVCILVLETAGVVVVRSSTMGSVLTLRKQRGRWPESGRPRRERMPSYQRPARGAASTRAAVEDAHVYPSVARGRGCADVESRAVLARK